ncbi:unnamed protein product [Linum trigynum]|uniref:Gnk2-homologous domain-containing protein n=1 Tax=Linum trigynum TaxID=586398 RepID=A0AAV2F3L2_9ROSI
MAYHTTFTASLMATAIIVLLAGGGQLRTSLGAPFCGDTPATYQEMFASVVHSLIDDLVQYTPSVLPDEFTYSRTVPSFGGRGSAVGTGTCYDQGEIKKTIEDCGKCLSELQPYLELCAKYFSSGGAFYEGRCMIQFQENLQ